MKWTRNERPSIGVRTLNKAEVRIAQKLEAEGYRVIKKGWPDFVAVKNGNIRFIEVKRSRNQTLKKHQQEMREILQAFGIEVEVMYGTD